MWRHLRLTSLGVIEQAELEFQEGFTAITGETGAGKTMIVTALGLLRGERADSGLIRRGANQARIEAHIDSNPKISEIVEGAAGEIDDGAVVLARVLTDQGRSRAYAGGAAVPLGVLAEISDYSVAVHGQADQYRLLRPGAQRAALDSFAGPKFAEEYLEYLNEYEHFVALRTRLEELQRSAVDRERELEQLRFAIAEIDEVNPAPEELAALNNESARLIHSEGLLAAARYANDLLLDDDSGAADALAKAAAELESGVRNDSSLEPLAKRVRELAIGAADVGAEIASYLSGLEVDPRRLELVEQRRADLNRILRKYGTDIPAVIEWANQARQRVADLDIDDDQVEALRSEQDELGNSLLKRAQKISKLRTEAAKKLSAEIEQELSQLAMPHARVNIEVRSPAQPTTADLNAAGIDAVEIMFTANVGAEFRPLTKAASGGELSRLMLALEVVLIDSSNVPTLVFDEVDAGIGGKAAVEVGKRLARLASRSQVFAVTHLPQVAAFADHHFHVEKTSDGSITVSSIRELHGEDRVTELARMLAGVDESLAAQDHARELLEMAAQSRK